MLFTLPIVVLAALPFAASLVINDELMSFCKSPSVARQSYIGDVEMSIMQCANLMKRQNQTTPSNVCGAECTTHCFNPAGGGPDPNDCNVIADALRYDAQDIAPEFNITTTSPLFVLQYRSCQSFFVNQASNVDLTYCRLDWAAVVDYVAFNCQAQQNAHGGLCVAASQQWFIQVQPFVNASATATSSSATETPTATETASSISTESVTSTATSSASESTITAPVTITSGSTVPITSESTISSVSTVTSETVSSVTSTSVSSSVSSSSETPTSTVTSSEVSSTTATATATTSA